MGKSGFNCWGVKGPALVIHVLRECIWNVPAVLLVLPIIKYGLPGFSSMSGSLSLGSMVPPWVTAFCFLVGNRKAELKPTTFLHYYFSVFSSFLFS